ncbi:hypothetical protein ACP70R_046362 [Stipagrostis hirtigluma subsp. patula]
MLPNYSHLGPDGLGDFCLHFAKDTFASIRPVNDMDREERRTERGS